MASDGCSERVVTEDVRKPPFPVTLTTKGWILMVTTLFFLPEPAP